MNNRELREALERQIAFRISRFRVAPKAASPLQRLIGRWSRAYLVDHWSSYAGAFRPPSTAAYEADDMRAFRMLAMNYTILEAEARDPLFWVKWCLPQAFAALSLLAVWSPYWLVCLIFALPWPSPWRRDALLRAYGMGISIHVWTYGRHSLPSVMAIKAKRIACGYYFWPSRDHLDLVQRLNSFNDAAISGRSCADSWAYRDVLFLLVAAKRYVPHGLSHRYQTYQRDKIVHEAHDLSVV